MSKIDDFIEMILKDLFEEEDMDGPLHRSFRTHGITSLQRFLILHEDDISGLYFVDGSTKKLLTILHYRQLKLFQMVPCPRHHDKE